MGKKFKVHSLIDKVYSRYNLYVALEKVKQNKGAGGVDRVSLEQFDRQRDLNLEEIHRLLYEDKYQPLPLRRVYIPKDNGDRRPLGIPAVRDRVVQQALLNRIEKIFEPKFLDCSFGFRPQRSPLQAVKRAGEYLKDGYSWMVKVDIKSFFDTVHHERLIDRVAEEIADGRVLRLIRKFLKSGVCEDMKVRIQTTGTPQGGVISPLLANIYLHPFDQAMTEAGIRLIRYADDILIFARTREEAERALNQARHILEQELGLSLSEEKTKIVHKSQGIEFLGYFFGYGYSDYKYPRNKAIQKFKVRIRWLTRRCQGKSLKEVIAQTNPVIRGWRNYFVYANTRKLFWQLDCWIENRMRAYKVKRWGLRTHLKMPHSLFQALGLATLNPTFYPNYNRLSPAMGQRYRKAVCGKAARTV